MRLLLRFMALACVISGLALTGFAQDKAPHNLSFRVGAGNSISIKQLSAEETSLNIPGSSFVNAQIGTNILHKNNASLFAGLELQTLIYYPTFNEKATLNYLSLLAGRTSRVDISRGLYVKYTGGLSLGTLAYASSSVYGNNSYSGGPARNVNTGLFNNLQVMFTGDEKDQKFGYGLGFDVVINGVPVYGNKSYPAYLKQNAFIQYGLSFNVNYNFKR